MDIRTYTALRRELKDMGYGHEYDWAQGLRTCSDPDHFAREYVWVVLNSGMKNQVAQKIADRLYPVIEAGGSAREAFGHPGKAAAIDLVWTMRHCYFLRYERLFAAGATQTIVDFAATLPWIGGITKWHLAKNWGADVAKPDRWLVRAAAEAGETVDGLCARLARESGDRVATVDLIIWRACNLGLWRPAGGCREASPKAKEN